MEQQADAASCSRRPETLRPLVRMVNWVSHFNTRLGAGSGIATMLMIFIVVPDVLLRAFFSYTIPGASEMAVLLLGAKIFMGLAGAEASGRNFRVTIAAQRLSPAARRALSVLSTLIALSVMVLLAWLTIRESFHSVEQGESTYGVTSFPVWPGRILVALGFTLLSLQLLMELLRHLLGMHPEHRPQEGSNDLPLI